MIIWQLKLLLIATALIGVGFSQVCLGSVIDKDGTIDRDVDLRVQATRSSRRKLTGVLYDWKIPLRLQANVYEVIIRPALTYGSKCWAMKVTNKINIATTEMMMLRGILGVSRRDHMRNGEIRRILHVSPIDEVMRGGRLRWFGHVQRRDANNGTRRVMDLVIQGTDDEDVPIRHGTKPPTDQGRHDRQGRPLGDRDKAIKVSKVTMMWTNLRELNINQCSDNQ